MNQEGQARKIDKKIEFILPKFNLANQIVKKASLQVKAHSEVFQDGNLPFMPDNKSSKRSSKGGDGESDHTPKPLSMMHFKSVPNQIEAN